MILGLKLEGVALPCALLQTRLDGSCPKCALINILQADTSHVFGKTSVYQHNVANSNFTSCFDTNDAFVLTFLICVIFGRIRRKLKLEERESLVFCSVG